MFSGFFSFSWRFDRVCGELLVVFSLVVGNWLVVGWGDGDGVYLIVRFLVGWFEFFYVVVGYEFTGESGSIGCFF